MKHFYRRSKQYDGLETERAEKKQQPPGEKKISKQQKNLKDRYSYAKTQNKITKDNAIK